MDEKTFMTAISTLCARINDLELDVSLKNHMIERLKRENEMLKAENKALTEHMPLAALARLEADQAEAE